VAVGRFSVNLGGPVFKGVADPNDGREGRQFEISAEAEDDAQEQGNVKGAGKERQVAGSVLQIAGNCPPVVPGVDDDRRQGKDAQVDMLVGPLGLAKSPERTGRLFS